LLKGYAYLNRTAFRKINKKYDKTVQARPTLRYMSEKVNKAWFVQSEVTENLMVATEDLYARYFERGNRKLAISKLRRIDKKSGDYSSNTFRSGLLLMAGILFAIQSLVYVGQHMRSEDPTLHVHTSYLLQVSLAQTGHRKVLTRADLRRLFSRCVPLFTVCFSLHGLDQSQNKPRFRF